MENVAIQVREAGKRWAIGGCLIAAAFVLGIISVRWAVAETALYVVPSVDVLEKARAWEPGNGEIPYRLGLYYLDYASPTNPDAAVPLLEEAVRLSPNNSDYWLAAGRARERTKSSADAEKALARAIVLAPSYWEPRWVLANYYVRRGKLDEAGEHLRKAIASNPDLAAQAVRTIWAASGKNAAVSVRVIGKSGAMRNSFLDFLQKSGLMDDAVAVWSAYVSDGGEIDGALVARGHTLSSALMAAGRRDEAVTLWARIDPKRAPVLDTIRNPRFEEKPQDRGGTPFDWTINRYADCWSSVDRDLAGGFRALRVDYANAPGGTTYVHAKQTVLVRPGASYTLRFKARLENIVTGGPPGVAVSDVEGRELGFVAMPVSGIPIDWTPFEVRFTAPASGLVDVAVLRKDCPGTCPIFGVLYLTDFTLAKGGA